MHAPPPGWVRSLAGRAPREAWWQQALRWSTLTLSAGIVAGVADPGLEWRPLAAEGAAVRAGDRVAVAAPETL